MRFQSGVLLAAGVLNCTFVWGAPSDIYLMAESPVVTYQPYITDAFSTGEQVQKSFSKLEEKEISYSAFTRMPKSAYRITVSVRCLTGESLNLSGPGQGVLKESAKFYLRSIIDNGTDHSVMLPQVEACTRNKLSVIPGVSTSYDIQVGGTETYSWIVNDLPKTDKKNAHTFSVWAENVDNGYVQTSVAGTGISYMVSPAIRLLQGFIEPVVLKGQ